MAAQSVEPAPKSLSTQLAFRPIGDDQFISVIPPDQMGNSKSIAYGGCTISASLHAAFQTVGPNYALYSATGSFLGPSLIDRPFIARVRRVRDTRSFATRVIDLSQSTEALPYETLARAAKEKPEKNERKVMIMIADFQTPEPETMLQYSVKPFRQYSPVEICKPNDQTALEMEEKGLLPPGVSEGLKKGFGLIKKLEFEQRAAPEGVMGQNFGAAAKWLKTSQDDLDVTEKTSADYFRHIGTTQTQAENVCGLSFMMDGALSFIPLAHSGMWFDETGPCSTLDFALRLYVTKIDLSKWHLREWRTMVADHARTYTESRLFDETGTKLVANMTQQCILRPAPKKEKL
ncbi:Thioesterase/thiol ester dehydrase-isomerase [Eremomyces bilateralis CBS 781.70]|uniref:Thioesterase/thiol ester dehydrase-isomerase n=1 Tax=Eremomyces bilateralis CBS 781.70 TaxID=1392243 RepID=A0A6G1G1H6_9PEZI|nr:Thioesterase/thiol ester dehydrase-isomerase [Eremomyces bilateralis CBS 781.70]KAF1811781.1 Thioesterase/thiol ester dehydrase-isomerase [Eremomyces bilateralis CBS 781.70]